MIFSAGAISVCLACVAGLASNHKDSAALKAAVAFIWLYLCVFVIGLFGVPFLYSSEIAPAHLWTAVFSISTAVSWLFNFLVAEVTPIAFTNIDWKCFIVYS